jgi:hypothetical protein
MAHLAQAGHAGVTVLGIIMPVASDLGSILSRLGWPVYAGRMTDAERDVEGAEGHELANTEADGEEGVVAVPRRRRRRRAGQV